ncbi:hypothetical protein GUJ93_ZPchr0002g26092 [Zizania palustris]|uniref:Uncharacterized protein n=1 Tax=Zizania palustris TaxID=103762 RepID=A0A8J5RI92_ZIZPA|nr:hypothetical protein GUJ93_ZPchr0002g26092 [Zizania palustris]
MVNAYDGVQIVDSIHKSKYHITTIADCSHCSCLRDPAFEMETADTENLLKEKHAVSSDLQGTVKMLGDGHTVTVLSVQSKSSSPHVCSHSPYQKRLKSSDYWICHAISRSSGGGYYPTDGCVESTDMPDLVGEAGV